MALHYELELLEELISITLHPKNLKNENSVKKRFTLWSRLAFTEKERVKKSIRNGLLCIEKEKQRKIYIQQHQSAIIYLQDTLHVYLQSVNPQKSSGNKDFAQLASLFQHFNQCLEDLLSFLEKHLTSYFNQEEKIPEGYTRSFQQEYSLRLKSLHKQLLQLTPDKALPQMICSILNDFLNKQKKKIITYRQLHYIKELMEELENLKNHNSINHYPSLLEMLIKLNFNCCSFKKYFLGFIKGEISNTNSLDDKLDKLYFHYKEINQVRIKKGRGLYSCSASVQKDIAGYLQREIQYLEKKRSLSISASDDSKGNEEETDEAIHLQMSVEELGLLTNIQKQAGLLKNTNMRKLAKLLATNHRSLRKDKLSWQNLYNCFSKVEMATINSLDDKLITMVNTLRKIKSDFKNR
jgi:hypothetical protein